MRIPALTFLLALLLPGVALAVSPEACDRMVFSHHIVETSHKDLGNGIVSFEKGGCIESSCSNHLYLVACKSGATLKVTTYHVTYPSEIFPEADGKAMDIQEKVAARVDELVNSQEAYRLEEVGGFLNVPERLYSMSFDEDEVCACRAFYPRHRNGKTRFEMEPGNR